MKDAPYRGREVLSMTITRVVKRKKTKDTKNITGSGLIGKENKVYSEICKRKLEMKKV